MDKETDEIVQFFKNDVCQIEIKENGEVWCWVWYFNMEKLSEIVSLNGINEGGIEARLQGDCIFFVANEILDYYGIDHDIFEG